MDSESTLILALVIAIIVVIIYMLYSFNMIPIPTQASVTVTYYSLNGNMSTITLPQQSGTAINILQGTSLLLSGTVKPNQTVTVYIYAPNGQLVYQQSAVAGTNGQFSMIVPSSNATPGVTFRVTLSLGHNYYFYVTVLAQNQLQRKG